MYPNVNPIPIEYCPRLRYIPQLNDQVSFVLLVMLHLNGPFVRYPSKKKKKRQSK